jgi:hypothetical protein
MGPHGALTLRAIRFDIQSYAGSRSLDSQIANTLLILLTMQICRDYIRIPTTHLWDH